MKFSNLLKDDVLIFDGAMGTMLQGMGLKFGENPEILNIKEREKIIEVHKKYIEAGANVITTNTFGANSLKLKNFTVEEIIKAAVENAKEAAKGSNTLIALDIGPLGELLEPMGTLSFQKAYEYFKEQVLCGVKFGVDIIIIETMVDLYEAKAAVLAVKENSKLPIICTMSFEENGRTFTGVRGAAMTLTLQGLGVDALGVNCSRGPKELHPIVDEILEFSKVPVIVQANAGLPCIDCGKVTYDISPLEFAEEAVKYAKKGVRIIGGCCGTTDEYIKKIAEYTKKTHINVQNRKLKNGVCSSSKIVFTEGIKVIGERINPTGKKLFKEALRNENYDYILREAVDEVNAGADILDVNVGLPEINEEEVMTRLIKEIQSILDVPLQIDSSNPKVIESALRAYNGKAIVNSVTGENKKLQEILPIVKKYGASVIGLTLDEKGIPKSIEDRILIADKIISAAKMYGISKDDIYIDCLTLTAAASQKEVMETLKALKLISENLKVKTVLGVSNVSFGLPNRELLNRTFLAAALTLGLNFPIINPCQSEIMDTIKAFKVLDGEDPSAKEYIYAYKDVKSIKENVSSKSEDLSTCIINGYKNEAKTFAEKLLKEKEPLAIVNEYMIPSLDKVGARYEKGEIFLPQLIQSAETVSFAMEVIKEKLKEEKEESIIKGKIILATVKGDIHDIGKNIVKVLLENYGFNVVDLGKDVPKELIVKKVIEEHIKIVGLSALMTTTVKSMEETIKEIKKASPSCKIIVGGAVLNKKYAEMIHADFYAKDARDTVNIASMLTK